MCARNPGGSNRRTEMMNPMRLGIALGAIGLLSAALQAAEPGAASDRRPGDPPSWGDRSRGFFGFSDWDSRFGGYDRFRRPDAKAPDTDKRAPAAAEPRRPAAPPANPPAADRGRDFRGGPPDRGNPREP